MKTPITYTRQGDQVTLEMSGDDFDQLLMILGYAAGSAHRDRELLTFYAWLDFTNRLNATNPSFTPYEIPEEYKRP